MIIFGSRAHYSALGGVENSLRALVQSASQSEKQLLLVCRYALPNESIDKNTLALPANVSVISYSDDTCFSLLRRLVNLFRGGIELPATYRRLFNQYPDAIVIVRHHSHVLAARFAGYRDVRYLVPSWSENQLAVEIDGEHWIKKSQLLIHKKIDGHLQRQAVMVSKIFVFSHSMKQQVLRALPLSLQRLPIKVVKPGIDPNRFYVSSKAEKIQLRAQLKLPTNAVVWLFVGRFVHAKGLHYLLEALNLSPKENILVMVGEGDLEDSINRYIVQNGLQQRVLFFKKLSHVEDFYRACDVFVMSSTYEPLGQTIIEASACGLPIAAFSQASGVMTATHELGLDFAITYVDQLKSAELSEAIKRAFDVVNDSVALVNSRKTHELYTWEKLLEDLLI